jgi:predicted branched-subunit amino acid permease
LPLARTEFLLGLRASAALQFGVAPFGLVAGVALAAAGVPPLEAMAMSVLVYAGASMIAAAQLLADGAPAAVIVFAAIFVNLRTMMYSASIRPFFAGLPLRRRAIAAYLLADNPYALCHSRWTEHPGSSAADRYAYYMGVGIPIWIVWQITVAAGVLLGAQLPASWKLDFAAPLVFIAVTIPLLRERAMVVAALSAAIVAILVHGLPFRLGLSVAGVSGIVAGILAARLAPPRAA